ncbi:hypothetical protein F2P81_023767 [Scophthalmus maximus]|uniref:Uncharacterized protein n=1 Tax=Scophthalmus maximus TaxID=52904 RepID=A0A6A4RS78_SCOMX|nr:hypothetical protein F2P81_023767 [Scophthalmus maximus]
MKMNSSAGLTENLCTKFHASAFSDKSVTDKHVWTWMDKKTEERRTNRGFFFFLVTGAASVFLFLFIEAMRPLLSSKAPNDLYCRAEGRRAKHIFVRDEERSKHWHLVVKEKNYSDKGFVVCISVIGIYARLKTAIHVIPFICMKWKSGSAVKKTKSQHITGGNGH